MMPGHAARLPMATTPDLWLLLGSGALLLLVATLQRDCRRRHRPPAPGHAPLGGNDAPSTSAGGSPSHASRSA